MGVLKCKMCGYPLAVVVGNPISKCEACGSTNTVSVKNIEKKSELYNRANYYRQNYEFDKAISVFEKIQTEDSSDSEAYWGQMLCEYGVQYVDDPHTHRKVPTCNRVQSVAVTSSTNYKQALDHADFLLQNEYKRQAVEIERIQRHILEVSAKEAPYDVFICYKEADNAGNRTTDSILAQELYKQLVSEKLRVFFSRITLEDKLGEQYEPYIYAALTSSPVMIVVATRPENVTSPWVKNEWSRFLGLKTAGAKKVLIPAYKGMGPYDFPDEFGYVEAQDLTKPGAMQDIAHQSRRIVDQCKSQQSVIQGLNQSEQKTVDRMLQRAFICIEDGDKSTAESLLNSCLNLEPTCAMAYVGQLLLERNFHSIKELSCGVIPLESSPKYHRALKYADETLKNTLCGASAIIQSRIIEREIQNTERIIKMESEKIEALQKDLAEKKRLFEKKMAELTKLTDDYNSKAALWVIFGVIIILFGICGVLSLHKMSFGWGLLNLFFVLPCVFCIGGCLIANPEKPDYKKKSETMKSYTDQVKMEVDKLQNEIKTETDKLQENQSRLVKLNNDSKYRKLSEYDEVSPNQRTPNLETTEPYRYKGSVSQAELDAMGVLSCI